MPHLSLWFQLISKFWSFSLLWWSIPVFGEDGVRLMCWAHVFRNIRPKLAAIRKANPALGASMLADVESIQWMVQSEAEFEDVCKNNKRHYLQQELTDVERKLWWTSWSISLLSGGLEAMLLTGMLALTLSASQTTRCNLICKEYLENYFFIFFSNQGMEGNHKEIKANHTFRTELPLGQFIQVLEQLVNTSHHFWSPK